MSPLLIISNRCDSTILSNSRCDRDLRQLPPITVSKSLFLQINLYYPNVLFMGQSKHNSPMCEAAERALPSGTILFADVIFIVK